MTIGINKNSYIQNYQTLNSNVQNTSYENSYLTNSIFAKNTVNSTNNTGLSDITATKNTENGCTDGVDDGKIGFGETVGNLLKGLISPVTSMFESPENFIKGVAMIAGGSILCAATGGAAAPLLVAAGVGMGGYQAIKGAVNAANATTDAEAKQAWQDIGAGTGAIALSVAGAKSAAKAGGFYEEGMTSFQATKACITNAGKSASASIEAFTSGSAMTNLKTAYASGKTKLSEKLKTNKTKSETLNTAKAAESTPNTTESAPAKGVKTEGNTNPAQKVSKQAETQAQTKSVKTPAETPSQTKTNVVENTDVNANKTINSTEANGNNITKTNQSSVNGKKVTLSDYSGNQVECRIEIKPSRKYTNGERINIIDPNGKTVGYAETYPSSEKLFLTENAQNYLGNEKGMFIEAMESQLKGGGTELHNMIKIRAQELGYGEKIFLEAGYNSPGFHYKNGFRYANSATNEAIASTLENTPSGKIPDLTKFGKRGNHMYYIGK